MRGRDSRGFCEAVGGGRGLCEGAGGLCEGFGGSGGLCQGVVSAVPGDELVTEGEAGHEASLLQPEDGGEGAGEEDSLVMRLSEEDSPVMGLSSPEEAFFPFSAALPRH